jgi:hypothetical protein
MNRNDRILHPTVSLATRFTLVCKVSGFKHKKKETSHPMTLDLVMPLKKTESNIMIFFNGNSRFWRMKYSIFEYSPLYILHHEDYNITDPTTLLHWPENDEWYLIASDTDLDYSRSIVYQPDL